MTIHINKQLNGAEHVELNRENFPRLYDGNIRVRNISIIDNGDTLDIQTIYHADELRAAILEHLRTKYQ